MSLSHDDLEQILRILNASQFHELHLEAGELKLTVRRSGTAAREGTLSSPPTTATEPRPCATVSDLYTISAPMLGTFYVAPRPGAAPFVTVGSRVDEHTVIGIIEVMKLMNSVTAGVRGEIVEILVRDGELVEYGQALVRVKEVA